MALKPHHPATDPIEPGQEALVELGQDTFVVCWQFLLAAETRSLLAAEQVARQRVEVATWTRSFQMGLQMLAEWLEGVARLEAARTTAWLSPMRSPMHSTMQLPQWTCTNQC
jgi:hypothetical protein